MTAAPILPERQEWTVDDLAELPKDLPYELINGRLIVPSPTALHQDLCVDVLLALDVNCPPEFLVSIDLSLQVDRRNEPRPDVVVIRRRARRPIARARSRTRCSPSRSSRRPPRSATCTTRRRSTRARASRRTGSSTRCTSGSR